MNSIKTASLVGTCAMLMAGCSTYQSQQEQAGMVIGGVLGGVLGSQLGGGHGHSSAIIVGTLVGAAIGGSVGHSMAEVDRLKTARALDTVRTGVPTSWTNPDSGNQYVVVPTRTIEAADGPCREYTIEAIVGGKKDTIFGTACRQTDGSWKVRN